MFDPDALDEKKIADERRNKAFKNIEEWALELIPENIRSDAYISSQEFACYDPNCSPVDTTVTIIFSG